MSKIKSEILLSNVLKSRVCRLGLRIDCSVFLYVCMLLSLYQRNQTVLRKNIELTKRQQRVLIVLRKKIVTGRIDEKTAECHLRLTHCQLYDQAVKTCTSVFVSVFVFEFIRPSRQNLYHQIVSSKHSLLDLC